MEGHKHFARIYRQNAVLTASPGQLVLMLFDGALCSMAIAHSALERPASDPARTEVCHKEILKAQAIIAELRTSLDREVGGDFATNMDRLYAYYTRRLIEANLRKKVEPLAEVEKLLKVVRDAWAEMLKTHDPQGSARTLASA
jgi:flagellar protein FliS